MFLTLLVTWLTTVELLGLNYSRCSCFVGAVSSPSRSAIATIIGRDFSDMYKQFVHLSKGLLQFADQSSKQLAKNLSNRSRPLLPYGITSFCPMIASTLAISGNVSALLHHAMLLLHGSSASKGCLPHKLRQAPFKYPKFTP